MNFFLFMFSQPQPCLLCLLFFISLPFLFLLFLFCFWSHAAHTYTYPPCFYFLFYVPIYFTSIRAFSSANAKKNLFYLLKMPILEHSHPQMQKKSILPTQNVNFSILPIHFYIHFTSYSLFDQTCY